MKRSRALIGVFMVLIVAVSFATFIQRQQNDTRALLSPLAVPSGTTYNPLAHPAATQFLLTSVSLNVNVAERNATVFSNFTRVGIYDFIKANPGVQFRGICNALGLSIGVAEFHLGVLKKAGLISFIRDGRYKRFFESKKFTQKQIQLISLFRHDTTRNIIKTMLDGKQVSHGELSNQLSITSQGVTWQINRLRQDDIIQESKDGMKLNYTLENTYAPMLTELVTLIEQP